jgi:hypothetical protein
MLNKIAAITVVLSLMSFSALAQENLIPRTMPLSDDKPAQKTVTPTITTQAITQEHTIPAVVTMTSANAPVYTSAAGNPSYSSSDTGGTAPQFSSALAGPLPYSSAGDLQQQNQTNETKLNNFFDEIDTNHDGLVNEAEFSIYYKTRADNPGFIKYDRNNDGQITRQEFEAGNTIGKKIVEPREPPKLNSQ